MNLFKYWLVAVAIGTAALASCSEKESKQDPAAIEALAERVWQFSQSHPDGFTVDVRTMEEPTEGIAVSYAATQGSHSRESLPSVVAHALTHDGYVGGWLDTESGLYYYDSTKLFPEDQLDEALEFAYANGQHSVYIISTGEDIRIDRKAKAA